jgi:hypothetical protein
MKLYSKFDFRNGVSLSSSELEKSRLACAEILKDNPDSHRTFELTGNMLTIAIRDENNRIRVFQAEGYIEYIYE